MGRGVMAFAAFGAAAASVMICQRRVQQAREDAEQHASAPPRAPVQQHAPAPSAAVLDAAPSIDARPLTPAEVAKVERQARDDRARAEKAARVELAAMRRQYAAGLERAMLEDVLVIVVAEGTDNAILHIKTEECSDVVLNSMVKTPGFLESQPKMRFARVVCENTSGRRWSVSYDWPKGAK